MENIIERKGKLAVAENHLKLALTELKDQGYMFTVITRTIEHSIQLVNKAYDQLRRKETDDG